MGLPNTISGFTVIPVLYNSRATHVLYGKAHTGSKTSNDKHLPKGRTLFLVNVPPFATEREVVLFFKCAGVVERVIFDLREVEEATLADESESEADEGEEEMQVDENVPEGERPSKRRRKGDKQKQVRPTLVPLPSPSVRTLRKTGRTAYVVFLDTSSLSRALSDPQKPRPWPNSSEPTGLAHYKSSYATRRPPLDAIREHAESAIAIFDYDEEQKKRKSQYKKGDAIVDEDGFTLVTRGGAYGQTIGGGIGVATKRFVETGEASASAKRQRKKKKEKKEKEGFYAFQKHEQKRQRKSVLMSHDIFVDVLCRAY